MSSSSELYSAPETSFVDEAKIVRDVVCRKRKQAAKKAQPWKDTYIPQPEDLPNSSSPHDKPWVNNNKPWNWEDSEYDTNGGQS